jgi:hypothetical protein
VSDSPHPPKPPYKRSPPPEHRRFLEENRPDVLAELQASGELDNCLAAIGATADERLEHAMRQHLRDPEVQKLPFLDKLRELQSRREAAEEGIRRDLIHQPIED